MQNVFFLAKWWWWLSRTNISFFQYISCCTKDPDDDDPPPCRWCCCFKLKFWNFFLKQKHCYCTVWQVYKSVMMMMMSNFDQKQCDVMRKQMKNIIDAMRNNDWIQLEICLLVIIKLMTFIDRYLSPPPTNQTKQTNLSNWIYRSNNQTQKIVFWKILILSLNVIMHFHFDHHKYSIRLKLNILKIFHFLFRGTMNFFETFNKFHLKKSNFPFLKCLPFTINFGLINKFQKFQFCWKQQLSQWKREGKTAHVFFVLPCIWLFRYRFCRLKQKTKFINHFFEVNLNLFGFVCLCIRVCPSNVFSLGFVWSIFNINNTNFFACFACLQFVSKISCCFASSSFIQSNEKIFNLYSY